MVFCALVCSIQPTYCTALSYRNQYSTALADSCLTQCLSLSPHNLYVPITIDHLRALGNEIRLRRKQNGITTLKQLEDLSGVSRQFLSAIENGYTAPKRGFTVPSDETLEKLASTLDIPLSRLHALLGRFPDTPYPAYSDVETAIIAERYDRLPTVYKRIVRDALHTAEAMANETESGANS